MPDVFPVVFRPISKPIEGKSSFRHRDCAAGSAGRETPETVFRRAESQGTREKPRHVKSSPCPLLHCSQGKALSLMETAGLRFEAGAFTGDSPFFLS
ncbi:hypothetical protein ABH19_04030 [Leptospirillum sp. Group II 'CF-1']|nr:hypothetical protein ABH19_04030 [Leptospirillum sp. Group II 'CF-1']